MVGNFIPTMQIAMN